MSAGYMEAPLVDLSIGASLALRLIATIGASSIAGKIGAAPLSFCARRENRGTGMETRWSGR
jgi:hypothetical protein